MGCDRGRDRLRSEVFYGYLHGEDTGDKLHPLRYIGGKLYRLFFGCIFL